MKTIQFLSVLFFAASTCLQAADSKNIILIAGVPSHGPGDHEFNAGCHLLSKCLNELPGIHAEVHNMGWPKDESVFDTADAVLIYADGGARHPAIKPERLALIDGLVKKGVGVACAHYGVEVAKGDPGKALHRWIGGYYEHLYSCNPMWTPEFLSFPDHPVANGVKPFKALDEWYINMRWSEGMKGVTPILVAKPSDDVRDGPYVYPKGPYPHIQGAKGRDETVMWVLQREDGGRGFGFTGGHKHLNWGNENYRKVVLNGLLWIAQAEVPENGVASTVSDWDLKQNLDDKRKR